MKILVKNYTFNKTAKTVTFTDYNPIVIERVLVITNVTSNVIIYNFADPTLGGTAATNVLTLSYDTSAMANTDKLQIFYDNELSSQSVSGDVASSATDSGNPVKAGGKYNVTAPTLTDGQRGDMTLDSGSCLRVVLGAGSNNTPYGADNADANAVSATSDKPKFLSRNTVYNGTYWDRMPGDTTGVKIQDGGNSITVDGAVAATLAAETTKVIGTVNVSTGQTIALAAGILKTGDTGLLGNVAADGTGSDYHVLVDTSGHLQVDVLTVPTVTVNSHAVTNAGTFAVQNDNVKVNGNVMLAGNGVTGTGSQRVTVASNNTPFPVKTDQTTHGTTDLVAADNVKINGVALLAGNGVTGTGSQRVTIASDNTAFPIIAAGNVAHDGVDSGNPIKMGGRASTTPVTAVSANDRVDAFFDVQGRQVVTQKALTGTSSNVAGSASSVTLLAANTARLGATVYNDSTAALYLKLGATASATSFAVKMQPDAYYEVPFGYYGVVDGIWGSATGSARVTELT